MHTPPILKGVYGKKGDLILKNIVEKLINNFKTEV